MKVETNPSLVSHDYVLYANGTIITDTKLMTPAQKKDIKL